MSKSSNIILIGMPGSGKSTLGRRLAKLRGLRFIDTDTLIERYENQPIQRVVNARGVRYLRQLESEILAGLDIDGHVIATGGSAVYSNSAIKHLRTIGTIVYLKISLQTLLRRVDNTSSRGLAKMPQHSLPRLYRERLPLYQQAADVEVDNNWPMTAVRIDRCNQTISSFITGNQ